MNLLISLGISLGLTLVLELGLALCVRLRGRRLLLVLLMNLLTNPAAVMAHFLLTYYAGWPFWASCLPLEGLVIAVEGLCLREVIRHPWWIAALLNAFSFSVGLILQL